jgi:hypothetical protein
MESPYNLVAGLDIHKKTVVVVVLQSPMVGTCQLTSPTSVDAIGAFGLNGRSGWISAVSDKLGSEARRVYLVLACSKSCTRRHESAQHVMSCELSRC